MVFYLDRLGRVIEACAHVRADQIPLLTAKYKAYHVGTWFGDGGQAVYPRFAWGPSTVLEKRARQGAFRPLPFLKYE